MGKRGTAVWILDSAYRDGGVDLWTKDDGTVHKVHHPYDPPFYVRFSDPVGCHEMIAMLEEQYGAAACSIRTLCGEVPGYAVHAGREVAEAIERQAQYTADLFNVDVRRDQRFMAERGLVPCTRDGEDRFSHEVVHDLLVMELSTRGNPASPAPLPELDLECGGETCRITGTTGDVLADLAGQLAAYDPDLILMPDAGIAVPRILTLAREHGIAVPFSRNGKYRTQAARSYWSYGRMEHKGAALVPDGRILIDTGQSFVYRAGGLSGVLMAARLAGIPPGPASRLTPGTLISSYEIREALRQGIVVPLRKNEPEQVRRIAELQAADRGGMMFQPESGTSEAVDEIDFTSLYPSIIVHENLSLETLGQKDRPGFLPEVLEPVIALRRTTKQLKKTDPRFAGADAVLKWMLVTCFGYTGYKNAKFGRIEVHEAITAASRDILLQTKEIAEGMGYSVLHGIVDCLWVQGEVPVGALKERVEQETGYPLEAEHFDWIVFLPLADGFGAYNRYYGRLSGGCIRVRGIAARRHDTPAYVQQVQCRMLGVMKQAKTIAELVETKDEVEGIFCKALRDLPNADPQQMAIGRRISRLTYRHRCLEGAAVQAYRDQGIPLAPGMKIRYVVEDARTYRAVPAPAAVTFDAAYNRTLLDRAREEIIAAYPSAAPGKKAPAWPSATLAARKPRAGNATLF